MKKIIATSVLSLIIAVPAFACGGPGKLMSELDLTSDQIAQLKELRQEKRANKQEHKTQRADFKARKKALMENYSDEEAEVLASEMAEMTKARMLNRMQSMQKMLAILTPEQKTEFKQLMADKGDDFHGSKGPRGMWF